MNGVILWPTAASAHARQVDLLIAGFGTMVWLLTLPVFLLMTWFAIRYRRTAQVNREHAPTHNLWVEIGWSVIPFVLVLGFYFRATRLYFDLYRPPADAMDIHIVAKRWMWKAQHADGAREIDDLHVPVGEAIRLTMTSEDVIHSFFVPALRIKQDVLPGRYTQTWFRADRAGRYALRCSQFCGTDHSLMIGTVEVMPAQQYAAWAASARDGGTDGTLAQRGAGLFRSAGCSACHAPGAAVRAPPLDGLAGRPVALADGSSAIADDRYLADAIVQPGRQVVAGYAPVMPDYSHVLSPGDVDALVAYIKSSGPRPSGDPEHAR